MGNTTEVTCLCERCKKVIPSKQVMLWRDKNTCIECKDSILKQSVGLVVHRQEVE